MPPTRAVILDLVGLIEHVQSGLRRIEETIARETSPGGPESSTGVIVLDDVSPRYMKAAAAVQACDVNLGISPCVPCSTPAQTIQAPPACRRLRSSGRKATRRRPAGAYEVPSPQIFSPTFPGR
jgi:hypothetical protein